MWKSLSNTSVGASTNFEAWLMLSGLMQNLKYKTQKQNEVCICTLRRENIQASSIGVTVGNCTVRLLRYDSWQSRLGLRQTWSGQLRWSWSLYRRRRRTIKPWFLISHWLFPKQLQLFDLSQALYVKCFLYCTNHGLAVALCSVLGAGGLCWYTGGKHTWCWCKRAADVWVCGCVLHNT